MTKGQINKNLDRLDKEFFAVIDKLISEGRGSEKGSETLVKTDPLSLEYKRIIDERQAFTNEVSRRYGPCAPSRL
jgi:hypothetical protein